MPPVDGEGYPPINPGLDTRLPTLLAGSLCCLGEAGREHCHRRVIVAPHRFASEPTHERLCMSNFNQSRRSLMIGGSAAVAAAFGGPINIMAKSALYRGQCLPGVASPLVDSPYGPTAPVNDLTTGLPLIELPVGFRYLSYGWTGDLMSDGLPTPGARDGMGVAVQRRIGVGNEIVLVRNHERSTSTSMASIIGISARR